MATVTQICDRVCSVSGLADTGSDRALVLSYVNQAYANSVLEVGGYVDSFSKPLTSGTADYTIGTAPLDVTDLSELKNVWVTDGAVQYRMVRQVPEYQLIALRQGSSPTSTPLFYALRGTTELLLYPTPGDSTTLGGSYVKQAPGLVESAPATGEESTPTAIPSAFHFDVIANRATALAMEYDNRFEEAAAYDTKWAAALDRLLVWTSRFGGPTLTNVGDTGFNGPRDLDTF